MKNFIPLASPDIRDEDINAVKEVLLSGNLVQGKNVENLEKKIAELYIRRTWETWRPLRINTTCAKKRGPSKKNKEEKNISAPESVCSRVHKTGFKGT